MAKRMLADVLWEAANERLWDGRGYYYSAPYGNYRFSCDAIENRTDLDEAQRCSISKFLKSLGCKTFSIHLFEDFSEGRQRQGVRYMWLLLAMHVAEDLGIEV